MLIKEQFQLIGCVICQCEYLHDTAGLLFTCSSTMLCVRGLRCQSRVQPMCTANASPTGNGLTCCMVAVQVKAAELASVQRLEAAELRKQEEKARRLEQARARALAETRLREKVAAATFARGYIKGIPQSPFSPAFCFPCPPPGLLPPTPTPHGPLPLPKAPPPTPIAVVLKPKGGHCIELGTLLGGAAGCADVRSSSSCLVLSQTWLIWRYQVSSRCTSSACRVR